MSETAEIYQRVIAKCPAAKVEGLRFLRHDPRDVDSFWLLKRSEDFVERVMHGKDIEPLIVHHWLTLLPPYVSLMRSVSEWAVCETGKPHVAGPTPFLALASYLERLP